jgi:hypothetical protein
MEKVALSQRDRKTSGKMNEKKDDQRLALALLQGRGPEKNER